MRDERDEVRAQSREPAELLRRIALGCICAHVLHRETDLPREHGDQARLLVREGIRLRAGDREHPEELLPGRQRRDDPRSQPDTGKLPLLRIARVGIHVAANDGLEVARDVLEHRARDRPGGTPWIQALGIGTRVRHHDRVVTLDEHDGEPLELEDPAELSEEAVEGLVLLERGRERAGNAVHRFELVGSSAQLVAQLLRLGGALVGDARLAAQARGQPADEEAHEDLEAEREGDCVEIEVPVEAIGAQDLSPGEEWRKQERHDDASGDAEPHCALGHGQEESLPDRRVRLPGVEDDDEGPDDRDVEREGGVREHPLCACAELPSREQPDDAGPDGERSCREPRPALVARWIAVGQKPDLDDRERHGEEPHPADPELDLAPALQLARHRRRSNAHSACSRRRSSSLSLQRSTAVARDASPEFPAAMSALRRRYRGSLRGK